MSTNAEDFRASFERARGSALTTAVAGCSGSGDGPPEEAEEPNEPAAGEEGSNTEAPEEETTDTDAEEQPEPEPLHSPNRREIRQTQRDARMREKRMASG